jgi:hypothetical protein
MAFYGQFKTGKDQRIVPLDVKVNTAMKLGELVTYAAGTNMISTAAGDTFAAALSAATHMVALTDETVGGIPGKVFPGSIQEAARLATTQFDGVAKSTDTAKKVGLYPLFDKSDILQKN